MARDTGRRVLDVAHDSYALTLYTLWQLQQMERHDGFIRNLEQHDLASLVAVAHHSPSKLSDAKDRFLNLFLPKTVNTQRQSDVMRRIAQHQRLIPIPPPPQS